MWWQQSLTDQTLGYSKWKKSQQSFKGRTWEEATKKMQRFLDIAKITGRFLCVEDEYYLTTTGEQVKSHIEQILESSLAYAERR